MIVINYEISQWFLSCYLVLITPNTVLCLLISCLSYIQSTKTHEMIALLPLSLLVWMPSICQPHNETFNCIQISTFECLKSHVVEKTATLSRGNEYDINAYSLLEKCTAFHFHNNLKFSCWESNCKLRKVVLFT